MRVQDTSGTYYWHIPTGTTQWEPPAGLARGSQGSTPCEEQPLAWTGFAPTERFGNGDFWKVRGGDSPALAVRPWLRRTSRAPR
uniref:WW domain-containing protein n=1 Tax=Anser cygnoides TaxID=8845 RepID=A0A8B9DX55_ANSCY